MYHAITWGPLVRELVLRATGQDLPELFRELIAAPLQADATLKATDAEVSRVAHVSTSPTWDAWSVQVTDMIGEDGLRFLTAGGALPVGLVTADGGLNDPRVLKAGLVSASGIATASALARIWSSAVVPTLGHRLLSEGGTALLTRERSGGPSATDNSSTGPFQRWGAGVQLSSDALPWLTEASFGHDGAGGQAGFADPHYQVGFGYLTNRMEVTSQVGQIVSALRAVLDAGERAEPAV
jgi:CubicO group peptidase (beta-lactamase class C family)